MREATTFFQALRGRKALVRQSEADFLLGCGVEPGTAAAATALKVRTELAHYAAVDANQLWADYRVESDLNINHGDSLDMLDVALSMEDVLDVKLDEAAVAELWRLNAADATTKELVAFFVARAHG